MPSFVGVVQIEYLAHPEGVTRDFLEFLAENADEADWQLGAFHNVMVEYQRQNLFALVHDYMSEHNPDASQKAEIQEWIDTLPWKDNTVMLHIDL